MPGRFGLFQNYNRLVLALRPNGESDYTVTSTLAKLDEPTNVYTFRESAWMLVEVQWAADVNGGAPMWYVNGKAHSQIGDGLATELTSDGDRFNLGFDTWYDYTEDLYWPGALREVELSDDIVWSEDKETTDPLMNARAMRLFGLASDTSPTPEFTRDSYAWVRGQRHRAAGHSSPPTSH